MRKIIVLIWLALLLSTISFLLWQEDWKYTLPTPVPKEYLVAKPVNGESVAISVQAPHNKPLFLHFFNPACPCSRFNIPHFQSLVKKYGDQLSFAMVVMSDKKKYTAEEIQDKYDLHIPVFFDKAIADSCRVYSTPQAVILDYEQKLYYRGNYNKSRFCEDRNTNFAQMAIDSLLQHSTHLITDKAALKSYGCSLPNCTKTN